MTLDLNSATGSEIRGQNTSIGWVRLGWGGQSHAGSDDSTGASDNAIAVDNDARYQQMAEHSLSGGGPLEFRVKVGGHGTVNASLLVFKVIKGTPSTSCPPLIPVCAVLGIGADLVDDAGGMVESAAQTMLGVVAKSFLEAYLLMFRWATTWWLCPMAPRPWPAPSTPVPGHGLFVAAFVLAVALIAPIDRVAPRRRGAGRHRRRGVQGRPGDRRGWSGLGVLWKLADQLTSAFAPSAANITVDPALGGPACVGGAWDGGAGAAALRDRVRR